MAEGGDDAFDEEAVGTEEGGVGEWTLWRLLIFGRRLVGGCCDWGGGPYIRLVRLF